MKNMLKSIICVLCVSSVSFYLIAQEEEVLEQEATETLKESSKEEQENQGAMAFLSNIQQVMQEVMSDLVDQLISMKNHKLEALLTAAGAIFAVKKGVHRSVGRELKLLLDTRSGKVENATLWFADGVVGFIKWIVPPIVICGTIAGTETLNIANQSNIYLSSIRTNALLMQMLISMSTLSKDDAEDLVDALTNDLIRKGISMPSFKDTETKTTQTDEDL